MRPEDKERLRKFEFGRTRKIRYGETVQDPEIMLLLMDCRQVLKKTRLGWDVLYGVMLDHLDGSEYLNATRAVKWSREEVVDALTAVLKKVWPSVKPVDQKIVLEELTAVMSKRYESG